MFNILQKFLQVQNQQYYHKVFIKQIKNQSTYSFAGQKLTVDTEYIAYYKLLAI